MLERWYSPYKITFNYGQICWLLSNIRELRIGVWPPNPEGKSSYTDPKIVVKGGEYKAYTENIGAIAGTVERRLLKTSMDGALAYLVYSDQLDYRWVARMFHMNETQVKARVNRAISYCVGRRDKRRLYR